VITVEQKKLEEIAEMTKGYRRLLILGCETCAAMSLAGGKRQAEEVAGAIRMARKMSGENGEIVGFNSHMVFSNHYVWPQGLTVDTKLRGTGRGRRLHEIGAEIARKNNLNMLRAVAVHHNIPVLEKLGYSKLQSWRIFATKARSISASYCNNQVDLKSYFFKSAKISSKRYNSLSTHKFRPRTG